MMGRYGWDGGGDWVAMGVMMTVFWVAVIGAAIAFVHYSRGQRHAGPPADSGRSQAQRLLDERFAKGDIDPAEYTQRRDLLNR